MGKGVEVGDQEGVGNEVDVVAVVGIGVGTGVADGVCPGVVTVFGDVGAKGEVRPFWVFC